MQRLPLLAAFLVASALSLGSLSAVEYHGIPVIAHRGAGFEVDENTVAACKHSYDMGIRGFEVDFRLTSDDQLVLMHDDSVKRTTGGEGVVEKMTLAEVQALRTKKDNAPVPTAADLFGYFADKPDIFIELEMKTSDKNLYPDERVERYCRMLHQQATEKLPAGTFIFTSFDRRTLETMKRLHPDAPVMLITGAAPTQALIDDAKKLGCSRVAIVMDLTTRKFVRDAQKAGLKVAGWPTRSEDDARLAVALGVNSMTTDLPSMFVEKKAQP
ncbi:MAG: glycerophosphodiester phosphodiesterase [Chthoniobacteraceae bacterium]